ncbi:hypothetical protein BFW38_05980 [Terasakiispira papahanaumokuakeensis]|uniref:Uncharacterized protein n=1 Tax=Terasakiispira papahanaumokuakeensis TaxID=197479 RepID=A0A1E2V8B5_9GAMM|nr:DUF3413 domain-containing protein [Terasakiispira papahanaumokuakeensis]ODC03163.1 hypothetical protein BFW38_05980 [Terasakiispira papahanaumokuakeensis]
MTQRTLPLGQRLHWLSLFILANSVLALLAGLKFFGWMPWPYSFWGWSYLLTALPGHYWLLTCLLMLPTCLMALIIPWRWPLLLLTALTASSGMMMLMIDSLVFDQYRFHINAFVIDLLLSDPNGQIISFSIGTWLTAVAVLVGIIGIEIGLAWGLYRHTVQRYATLSNTSDPKATRSTARWHLVAFLLLLSSHLIHLVADARFIQDVTRQPRFYPLMFATTAQSFMEKHGWLDTEARDRQAKLQSDQGAHDLAYPKTALECRPNANPPNILIIILDSWRGDSLSASISPNIQRFSDQYGWTFTQNMSASNNTRGGIFSLMYGLPPLYWHVMMNNTIPSQFVTTLQQQNYDLGIFASAKLNKPEFDRTVFASVPDLRMTSQGDSPSERDAQLTQDWLKWLSSQQSSAKQKPFFGFLFYDAPHGFDYPDDAPAPFQPAWSEVNYLKLNNNTDPTGFINRYRNAIHFDDQLVGQVLSDLEKRGLRENTWVIITGDHGQEFNDLKQNYWGHNSNFSRYQLHTPMIIAAPGHTPNQLDQLSSHLDVVPTLMTEALNCQNPASDYSLGHNMLSPDYHRDNLMFGSYLAYGMAKDSTKLVIDDHGQHTVYDAAYKAKDDQSLPAWTMRLMQQMRQFFKTE